MLRILAVTNVYPTAKTPTLGTYIEQQIKGLKQIGLEVDIVHVDRMQKGMRAYLGLGRKVRESVRRSHSDLVHIMYGGVMADEVTRTINDRPTIVSFCGSDLLGENLSGTIRKLVSRYGILASHRAAGRATGIIVKSKNLYDVLPSGLDRNKVRIIPNGVDLELFKPIDRGECRARLEWNPESFHVLFPTNHGDPCKRYYLAKNAVNRLSRAGLSVVLHELRGIPHPEVPIWLNASDVVLLTSLHEGSPNIVKEALACDVPVVSVDVGDVRERTQGIEGCYLALPEAADLAAKLSMVFHGERRVAGRIKMDKLSLKQVALELKTFYQHALGSCAYSLSTKNLTA
jgi:teichuronic acid biosynthesis glycosyltransferase TuaC